MSSQQNRGRDPVKRAERRKRQREALARGAVPTTAKAPRPSQSQMTHASSNRVIKHARDGERLLAAQIEPTHESEE